MPILIEQTIGKLRQYITIDKDITKYPFCAELRDHKDLWRGCSDEYFEEGITVFINGESKEIEIDGYIFDSKFRYKTMHLKRQKKITHDFKINGMTPTGIIFEIDFEITGHEAALVYIIYAMVIISTVGETTASEVWNILRGSKEFNEIEDLLGSIKEIKKLEKDITAKYPFIKQFFQQGEKDLCENAKRKVDQLTCFK